MKIINDVTVVIRKKSFPSFIDELYKRDCELLDLQQIEESGDGHLYTLRVASNNLKRFEEFLAVIGGAGEKYRLISVKNVIEERVAGGLINVSSKMPIENIADFNTSVMGATDLVHEKIRGNDGPRFSGIARSVGMLSGVRAADETELESLFHEYADAERDAVILNRFAGLNGYPLTVLYDHPEDIVTVMKRIERNFSALRIIHIDEATVMLYDLLYSELTIPVVSLEFDDLPLLLMALIIKIMMKYRLKAEESTVGFIGIDLSAVRLTRVLDKAGFRRVLGFDHGEKAMLALENQGGLATTAENIFGNADITVLLKNNFDHEEYRKIRPGQFVISLLAEGDPGMEVASGKGVREYLRRDMSHLAAIFPGVLKGVIEANIRTISDPKIVEYAKKLVPLLSDTFDLPHLFGDIHEQVRRVIAADAAK
ncbi:MAG: hypothetical protein JW807_02110 [Spirochaetes bacterium]|nr:hypothetical protein [Spirochaetota bacterium]